MNCLFVEWTWTSTSFFLFRESIKNPLYLVFMREFHDAFFFIWIAKVVRYCFRARWRSRTRWRACSTWLRSLTLWTWVVLLFTAGRTAASCRSWASSSDLMSSRSDRSPLSPLSKSYRFEAVVPSFSHTVSVLGSSCLSEKLSLCGPFS